MAISYKQLAEENKTLQQNIRTLTSKHTELEKKYDQLFQSYEKILLELQQLKRGKFGSSSEKDKDTDGDENEPDADSGQESTTITVQAYTRTKSTKKDLSKYERKIEIIPVPEEDMICSCGCRKKIIRYEIKEMFDFIPAKFTILEQKREVAACSKCCAGSITTAPLPPHILPKAKVTENLLAQIAVDKFHNRQPLYHLEKYAHAVDISRETMARWLICLVPSLQPIFNLMKDVVIDYDISSIDATTLQVLREPGRPATTKSYLYCITGGPQEKKTIIYAYNDKEHKQFVDEYLEGFKGYCSMDADNFFDSFTSDPEVYPIYCHAHARRKFEAIKKNAKKQGLAHEAIRFYKKLYRIEKQAKQTNLSFEERFKLRQEKSLPILLEFKEWIDKNLQEVLPESPIAKALNYLHCRWEGFMTFLTDGRLEIDNNSTEQEIKPIVIARKNFLFAYSVAGAKAIAMFMSLIRTALAHNLKPYDYLIAIFKRIPRCSNHEDYEALLPWNIKILQDTS